MKFEWQEIARKDSFGWTERAKVPGGWLIRTCAISDYRMVPLQTFPGLVATDKGVTITDTISLAMTFIADPTHSWEIEEEDINEKGWT